MLQIPFLAVISASLCLTLLYVVSPYGNIRQLYYAKRIPVKKLTLNTVLMEERSLNIYSETESGKNNRKVITGLIGKTLDVNNTVISEWKCCGREELSSGKELVEKLREGRFKLYISLASDSINELIINRCDVDYVLDTKGFLRPVYSLEADIDGTEARIMLQ